MSNDLVMCLSNTIVKKIVIEARALVHCRSQSIAVLA